MKNYIDNIDFGYRVGDYIKRLEEVALVKIGESIRFTKAIKFLQNYLDDFILIGGLSASFYAPARLTEDVDILVKSELDVNNLYSLTKDKVKWVRKHSFIFEDIEVEILSPEFLKLPIEVANYVFDTNVNHFSGVVTPSPEGVILLKLYAFREIDKQDVYNIIKAQGNSLKIQDIRNLLFVEAQRIFFDNTLGSLRFILEDSL